MEALKPVLTSLKMLTGEVYDKAVLARLYNGEKYDNNKFIPERRLARGVPACLKITPSCG